MLLIQLVRVFRKLRSRKTMGITSIGLMLVIALVGNALCFWYFDGGPDNPISFGDALWYSVISVTTIGYGDYYASSLGARLGMIVFIVGFGLTAFTIFFGLVVDWFTDLALKGERGLGKAMTTGHTIIVHFPSKARVQQLVQEIRSGRSHQSKDIVIVADDIERLPFVDDDILFVRGSSLSRETFERAGVGEAREAIVLATSYSDPNSDAVVASAVSVLDSMKPELHIVAECLSDEHRQLFDAVRCDAVICALRITGNLLVQEAQDPGVSQTFDVITSNLTGDTLFSTKVEQVDHASSYSPLVKQLMDHDVNVLAVVRGKQTFTNFARTKPEAGDRLVYLAEHRLTWVELSQRLRSAERKEAGA